MIFGVFSTSVGAEKPSSTENGGLFVLSNMFVAQLQQSLLGALKLPSSLLRCHTL